MIYARLAIVMRGAAEASTFVEAYELDAETSPKVPKKLIGKALNEKEAQRLLERIAS